MKSKIFKIVLITLIAAAVAYWYFIFNIDKEKAKKIIIENGGSIAPTMSADFLIAWARAIRLSIFGKTSFAFNNSTYDIKTGKPIQLMRAMMSNVTSVHHASPDDKDFNIQS